MNGLWHLVCFEAGHDCARQMVLIAGSASAARKKASEKCGDEGPRVWLDADQSSCKKIGTPVKGLNVDFLVQDFLEG